MGSCLLSIARTIAMISLPNTVVLGWNSLDWSDRFKIVIILLIKRRMRQTIFTYKALYWLQGTRVKFQWMKKVSPYGPKVTNDICITNMWGCAWKIHARRHLTVKLICIHSNRLVSLPVKKSTYNTFISRPFWKGWLIQIVGAIFWPKGGGVGVGGYLHRYLWSNMSCAWY